jgi:hypothetical protein
MDVVGVTYGPCQKYKALAVHNVFSTGINWFLAIHLLQLDFCVGLHHQGQRFPYVPTVKVIASNEMNGKKVYIWKEAVTVDFKVLSQYSHGESKIMKHLSVASQ